MKQETIIVHPKDFEKVKKKTSEEGVEKFHVLSDFDRTITYGLSGEGKRTATVISQLRSDPEYLGQKYFDEAHKLHEEYYPIEISSSISLKEKKKKMYEWWSKHFELLVKSGLSKSLISRVVKERPLQFRVGTLEFLSYLNERGIPVIFMSAAPGDMLIEYLKQNNLMFPNVYIISNRYEFNSKGRAVKIKEPIIHSFNKSEIVLKSHPIYDKIKDRKNVLLMGDSFGDVGMIEGFNYENLIKIGFYNDPQEGTLQDFISHFDVVLTGDQNFSFVNKLMREMFG